MNTFKAISVQITSNDDLDSILCGKFDPTIQGASGRFARSEDKKQIEKILNFALSLAPRSEIITIEYDCEVFEGNLILDNGVIVNV